MQKNDLLTGFVTNIGYNGEGVVKVGGTVVFVPFAICGEEISFKVLKVKGNVAYGKLISVIAPSPDRVRPLCPAFKRCGGCQLQHLKYEEQINVKADIVTECFHKIAGLDVSIEKKFLSPFAYGYRNKLQLPVRSEKGIVKVGFFRENSHDIVETDDCPLQPDWAKKVISKIKEFISSSGISCYDEQKKKGLLRHVIVREAGDEFLVVIVLSKRVKKYDNGLIGAFSEIFDRFSLIVNINERSDNVILGEEFFVVYGSGKANIEEFGVKFELGARSFYQVNAAVKSQIYGDVLNDSRIDGDTVVIDAYSGAGVLTAMLSKRAKKAYGIEIVEEAVESANDLAERNGISNMENVCAPCEDALPKIIEKAKSEGKRTVLVLDPPRKGVDREVVKAVLKSVPDEIIYISCSPQTLSRDVGLLVGSLKDENGAIINLSAGFSKNYNIDSVSVYDMFPQTKHVETLVCLSHKF